MPVRSWNRSRNARLLPVRPVGAARGAAVNGHAAFHDYLLDLGAGADLDLAADGLAQVFAHLGRTSAMFFLFSAGWRPRESGGMEGLAVPANG